MAQIKITSDGARGDIEVDGVPVKGVLEANVMMEPSCFPVVEVRLIATESTLDFKDGVLKVGALDAPEALERALLAHLQAKYATRTFLGLPVVAMDRARGPDLTAVVAIDNAGEVFGAPVVIAPADALMAAVRSMSKGHGGPA